MNWEEIALKPLKDLTMKLLIKELYAFAHNPTAVDDPFIFCFGLFFFFT